MYILESIQLSDSFSLLFQFSFDNNIIIANPSQDIIWGNPDTPPALLVVFFSPFK